MLDNPISAPRAHLPIWVEEQTNSPGLVQIGARREHRVLVHTGAAMRGDCGRQTFTYRSGDIDLVPAGWSDVCLQHDPSTALVLQLSPALLRRAAEETGRHGNSFEARHQMRDARIEHIAQALNIERRDGYPNGLLYAESLGLALAVHLVGGYGESEKPARSLSPSELQKLTGYIEENLDRDLSLAALAGFLGMSMSHLKTLFRRSTGVPVHQYVVQRRVQRAKELLIRTNLPASQIALDAGFTHQSHMARCMRRVLGVTPKALPRRA